MLVGICDDELVIRKELIAYCEKFKENNLTDFQVLTFSSGEELLQCKQTIDILFLDIQMSGLDGLRTAEKIRELDDGMTIIFLTGYSGYLQAGYKVRAFRYLLKPVKEEEFTDTLIEAIQDIKKNSKVIVGLDGDVNFLKLRDIIYIEHVERNTVARTRRGVYETIMTMSEWESTLDNSDFYRVHKAYIVNMEYIEEVGKQILLDNGEKVELAIRQVAKLKKACKAYRKRNAR